MQSLELAMNEALRAIGMEETVPTLPSAHAVQLIELVERWGVPAEQLLCESGLSRLGLADPAGQLLVSEFSRLMQRARLLTGEPALGFYLGLRLYVSMHEYVRSAAMAADLRQALELACQFVTTHGSGLTLRLEECGAEAGLVVDEPCDLGEGRDAIVVPFLVALSKLGRAMTGEELPSTLDFVFSEPDYFCRLESLFGGRSRFSRPDNRWSFDAAALDRPLVALDATGIRRARDECEHELEQLRQGNELLKRVEALLRRQDGGYRTLVELAAALHTSPRTLKRRLQAHGTCYSELLDRARRAEAERLLVSNLSIQQIATWLGYSDAANFTRAFRRWTGQTPGKSRGELTDR
jgi:AraC-like DNA-binding protein